MHPSGSRHPVQRTIVAAAVIWLLASLRGAPLEAQLALLTPAEQDAQLAIVAAEAARRGPVTPIPLLGNGSRALGALYDRFHLGVLIGRAQIAANQPPDAADIAASPLWQSRGVVIVAYPINCDGKPNQPLAIRATGIASIAPTPIGEAVRGAAQTLLPGISLPGDALVQSFRNLPPIGGTVEIDYAGPACGGAATTATLALGTSPSKSLLAGMLGVKLPDNLAVPTPATVRMQVLLDTDGQVRFSKQVQGPLELGPAATALLASRKFDPWSVNGVAVPQWSIAPIVFTPTGERAEPEPFRPGALPGQVMTSGVVTVEANPRMPPPPATARPPVAPAPPGQSDTQLAQLAIELAQKTDPTPISMDAAGPAVHGVLFDRFLVAAVKARAAAAAGSPMDPAAASPALVRTEGIAVAFPLTCPGGTVAPNDVQISMGGATSDVVGQRGAVFSGSELTARLPGVALPAGAVGRAFANASFAQNVEVRITYADRACPGDSNIVILPIQYVRGTSMGRVTTLKLPAEAASLPSPTMVQIRGLVDHEGRYRFPSLAEGPAELAQAAQVAAANWRFQPFRANGVPTPTFVITSLTFTTSGMPEPMPGSPAARPPQPPPGTPLANSTVGGRPATIVSADVPGLIAATSKCAIAEDDAYGFTMAGAIKVGGGVREGPAIERAYLSALRGPAGQGLRAVRLGSTMGPDGTILDMYEVTHSGLDQPVKLYLDEYHTEALKAPKGFTCASALNSGR